MSNIIPSVVRTIVPIIVTAIGPWVLTYLGIDSEQLATILSPVLAGAGYLAVRLLEKRWPRAGWLLLWPSAPEYQGRHEAE